MGAQRVERPAIELQFHEHGRRRRGVRCEHRDHGQRVAGTPSPPALQALYRKARAAGQHSVVVYGPSAGTDKPLYDAFHQAFPAITVSGVPVVGPPMTAKITAEFGSGTHVGDIAYTGNTDMLAYAAKRWLVPFKPTTLPPASKLPPETMGPGDAFMGTSFAGPGVVYDTNLVPAAKVPKAWQDLLHPMRKGKIGMYNPTVIGEMADVFAHLDASGEYAHVMAGLHAQHVQLSSPTTITEPLTSVAQGAKAIGVAEPFAFYMGAKKAGAPGRVHPAARRQLHHHAVHGRAQGRAGSARRAAVRGLAVHAPAARVIAAEGAYSALPHAPSPAGLPPYRSIDFLTPIPFSRVESADNGAIEAAKKYWGG